MEETELKLKTARTLKWNTIDKFASQVFYGVTGVVRREDKRFSGSAAVYKCQNIGPERLVKAL